MSKNNAAKKGFERKQKKDGSPNPKYVDLLEVDKPLAGQTFGCFSFISPEKILKQREMFYFEEFLKQWEMNKSMEKFHQFLNFLSFKHNFQTSVKGFKARGNFASQEEAELRAKLLRESDPSFDVFIGPIGTWLPWEPEAYKTGRVEYMEEELNQLAHEKKKNEEIAKNTFEQRVKETKQKAIDENKKNAEKHGNVLTQDIDEEGNLIGVGHNTTEQTFNTKDPESISIADIRSELFDGENIVVGKTDYGQSQLKSGPFAKKTD